MMSTLDERIEALRDVRCWRLCGLFLEDRSMNRYTLRELEAWKSWAAYFRFRGKNWNVFVTAENPDGGERLTLDWSDDFRDLCGGGKKFAFEAMCKDLYEFTERRRSAAAAKN